MRHHITLLPKRQRVTSANDNTEKTGAQVIVAAMENSKKARSSA